MSYGVVAASDCTTAYVVIHSIRVYSTSSIHVTSGHIEPLVHLRLPANNTPTLLARQDDQHFTRKRITTHICLVSGGRKIVHCEQSILKHTESHHAIMKLRRILCQLRQTHQHALPPTSSCARFPAVSPAAGKCLSCLSSSQLSLHVRQRFTNYLCNFNFLGFFLFMLFPSSANNRVKYVVPRCHAAHNGDTDVDITKCTRHVRSARPACIASHDAPYDCTTLHTEVNC